VDPRRLERPFALRPRLVRTSLEQRAAAARRLSRYNIGRSTSLAASRSTTTPPASAWRSPWAERRSRTCRESAVTHTEAVPKSIAKSRPRTASRAMPLIQVQSLARRGRGVELECTAGGSNSTPLVRVRHERGWRCNRTGSPRSHDASAHAAFASAASGWKVTSMTFKRRMP
jgi:hypothetical protein